MKILFTIMIVLAAKFTFAASDFKNVDCPSQKTSPTTQNYASYYQKMDRQNCMKDWAVLIYMAADNELTPYAFWDLYEMEARIAGEKNLGASTDKVDVLVELDTFARTGIHRYHVFEQDLAYDRQLRLPDFERQSEKNVHSPVVKWFPETGEGSLRSQKKRFQQFLNWALEKYPARNYMVVVWGHGEGYIGPHVETLKRPQGLHERDKAVSELLTKDMVYLDVAMNPTQFNIDGKPFGGVAFDHSDNTYLDIDSIKNTLRAFNFLREQKSGKSNNVEILAFDACLMQSLEVATELLGTTDYLIGSEQIQNYLGLPYRKILDLVNATSNSYHVAKSIPSLVAKAYASDGYQFDIDPKMARTFTVSTLTMEEMRLQLLPELLNFSKAMSDYLTEDFSHPMELAFILEQSASFKGEGRDLGVFLGTVLKLLSQEEKARGLSATGENLRTNVQNVLEALHRSLTAYAYGDAYINPDASENQSYLLGFFKGLTIWLPDTPDLYQAREKEMLTSELFKYGQDALAWKIWIDHILSPIE